VKDLYTAPSIRTYLYRPNSIVGIPDEGNPVIDKFTLDQNYPNPFNGSTIIRFRLPSRNRVSLTIYDISGKEVIRLINNQVYAPGEHSIKWKGQNNIGKEVSSGIYFYELKAGDFKQVKKMLLIQ
jgi:hypothetical protein